MFSCCDYAIAFVLLELLQLWLVTSARYKPMCNNYPDVNKKFAVLGTEFVGTGALHLVDSLLVHNKVAGLEIKRLQDVDPFIEAKTCVLENSVIAASSSSVGELL